MNPLSQLARECIAACLKCHGVCDGTAMTYCLEMGGEHVRPQHFRLMMDCAILCQATADLMAQKSQFHHRMCALFADVCDTCAEDCASMKGMEECVATCRACAQACRSMLH